MRKLVLAAVAGAMVLSLGACGGRKGMGGSGLDEFAVARRAPLVVPPDFSLVPPKPGAPRPQEADSSTQALSALFGGEAPRSTGEGKLIDDAETTRAAPGIRSDVGQAGFPSTVDKGNATQQIIAAPVGNGQDASVSTPQ